MRFFIKGDKKAFEQIYARYESFVVNFFTDDCGMIRKKQRILRDLFTKIIDKPDSFDPSRTFKTWLFSVANNMCKKRDKNKE